VVAPSPEAVFAGIAGSPGAVWLDGGEGPQGWSYLLAEPVASIAGDGLDARTEGRALMGTVDRTGSRGVAPFDRGVVGWIGADAGTTWEPALPPSRASTEPHVALAAYNGGLAFRHSDRTWHPIGAPSARARALAWLHDAKHPPLPVPPARRPRLRSLSQATFEARVRTALAAIADGEVYQLNLSRAVWLEGVDDAWDVWRRLRAASAPERGAFLRWSRRLAVLSNSPETFLVLEGRTLSSSPIKGTRPRAKDPARDAALAVSLRDDPKEVAELTMIIDLVRNDLGRIAAPGSVQAGPRELTTHSYVHHAQAEVRATLAIGLDAWDALAATFPPGSVTGCPKIRALHHIARLEDDGRGVYCGAIGYVDADGDAAWSVAIRTAVVDGTTARFHVGAGIVADSTPTAEWEETEAKGHALRAAFGV
jgi:para-aminobenzoate synthetase component 1